MQSCSKIVFFGGGIIEKNPILFSCRTSVYIFSCRTQTTFKSYGQKTSKDKKIGEVLSPCLLAGLGKFHEL